ncbi:hypothetical protein [uncultured Imperialibacter sp.]|uniref:hypothetical protein n=1 Tax=uncultured Imperialibacter sp. TaxID=1672639 RepID=UPI0030DDA823
MATKTWRRILSGGSIKETEAGRRETGDRRAGVGTIALPFCVGNRQTPERLKGRRKFEDGRQKTGDRSWTTGGGGRKVGSLPHYWRDGSRRRYGSAGNSAGSRQPPEDQVKSFAPLRLCEQPESGNC